MLPFYSYKYSLVAVAVTFCLLLLYSTCRLMCHCSIYGCGKRINVISLLTATYLITLCDNTFIILMMLFYHINIYSALHRHHQIPNIIYICGFYGILWLNFLLNCSIICGWLMLFSGLFGLRPSTSNKLIYIALMSALVYLIIVSVAYILQLESYIVYIAYIDLLPITMNILTGLICLCKLPLSQPIDLSIGLYQRNTLCSCYTTITQYIWMMIMIAISQSIIVMVIALEIDVWQYNIEQLMYFMSQFIALVLIYNFVSVSIEQYTRQNIILAVLLGRAQYSIPLHAEVKEHIEHILEVKEHKHHIAIQSNSNIMFTVSDIDPEHNFRIIEPLGEGAYGPVFAAVDARDQETVALKVMSYNPNDCDDLMSEIKILKKCRSRYIVNFKDTFYKEEHIWLVMELCDGGSILDVMTITKQHLTEIECACVLYQALCGLIYLHSIPLIHRDIKAANILVNSKGCCKLADMGCCKLADCAGTTIGSPYWMAPEVISSASGSYHTSADIWSLGIVAIEIAIGKPPLSQYKPMEAMLMIPKTDAPTITPTEAKQYNLSTQFIEFISKCLKTKPEQRLSAKQLMRDPWIQRVETDNERQLIQLMERAIPLLEEERKLSAFIANQDDSLSQHQEMKVEQDPDIEIQHQPTGTFMVVPIEDLYDNETIMRNEDTLEDATEVRHYTDSSASDDDDGDPQESDDSDPSRIIMEF